MRAKGGKGGWKRRMAKGGKWEVRKKCGRKGRMVGKGEG